MKKPKLFIPLGRPIHLPTCKMQDGSKTKQGFRFPYGLSI